MMMKCPERKHHLAKTLHTSKKHRVHFWVSMGPAFPCPSPSQVLKSHGVSCVNVEAHDATARIEHKDSRPK